MVARGRQVGAGAGLRLVARIVRPNAFAGRMVANALRVRWSAEFVISKETEPVPRVRPLLPKS